ncbi:MAG: ParB N-terminal domain-containing protein [Bdellovibrionales bacterium]|nr:ParB N-terminal domain-containing protein [Bdellovibrionales bacterium]
MAKKIALGKGIASLLQDAAPQQVVNQSYNNHFGSQGESEDGERAPVETRVEIRYENTPLLVDIGSIKTNPNQPRKIFKEKDLEELAESIRENGIIKPLKVAELENGEY